MVLETGLTLLALLVLVVVMLLSAAAEVLSLATVLPFLSVLSDPRRLWGLAAVRGLAQQASWPRLPLARPPQANKKSLPLRVR